MPNNEQITINVEVAPTLNDSFELSEEQDWDIPVKKKKQPMHAYAFNPDQIMANSPGRIPRETLFARASKIPRPDYPFHSNGVACAICGCAGSSHNPKTSICSRGCGGCKGFIYQEQINRVMFTEFLRWSKRWIKANKKRDMKRLREIWSSLGNMGHLYYCGTCNTSTFGNNLHGAIKRHEGLQCASCAQCTTCCECVSCTSCKRRKHLKQVCKVCNVCNQCCQCRQCEVCNRDCSYNYCGYSFTDYQRKHTPGCQRCYKCCDCGDVCKVPFGSFAKPVFHKPTLKQHTKNPSSRYVAAEIECAAIAGHGRGIYEVARRWGGATVGDGSLHPRGFEVNTAPAGGDLYVQQVEEICAAIKLQNGMLDQKCGLHVHVDARDMNYYDIRRLVRIYASIEDALFAMVSPLRIQGVADDKGEIHQYCQPCGKKYVAAIEEGRLPYDKIKSDVITSVYSGPSTQNLRHKKRGNGIPRYNALNLHSWFYRGTIECRMFDGSIDPDPITKWGILWAMIIDYTVKSTDEQVAQDIVGRPLACLKKIVAGEKNILDFIAQRVLMFGNDQMKRDIKELF